jgi:membrane protease YdiL (CAAX protease family)
MMLTSPTGRLQPIWSFLLSVAFSFAAFVVCSFLAAAITGDHILRFEGIFRPLLVAALFGIYLWLLTVADQVEENRLAVLGFPLTSGWKRQLAAGCLLGTILTSLAVLAVAIWGDLGVTIHLNTGTLLRVLVELIVLACGALAEEMMFRGYPFQRLEEAIGPVGSIGVFSVLFGIVHLTNPGASAWGLLNTVLIGIVLAIAYLRTRALWLPWGLHFGWNAMLGLVYGLPVSGLRLFNVLVHTSSKGPRWLTGGTYGIEASAPGAAAVVIGLIVVWHWPVARLGEPLTFPRQGPEHLDSVAGIET